jgi:signal transduction histidine kinase
MPRLNIRQKIIFAIITFTVCFGCVALLSFSNMGQLKTSIGLVEKTDDIANLVLELRRVEKNFFLYQDKRFFAQAGGYIKQISALLDTIRAKKEMKYAAILTARMKDELQNYDTIISNMEYSAKNFKIFPANSQENLRECGKTLVETAKSISASERLKIFTINEKLRTNLMVSMTGVAMIMVLLVFFFFKNILRPLKQVQNATRRIASGTFKPLEIHNDHDEIQQVFAALNSMVEQLNKRQEQLIQARKLSSIGTLASGMAHQLNNPLNNISTSCQILMENKSGEDPFADKMMKNISQETLRARDIVQGLLDFSRQKDYAPSNSSLKFVTERVEGLVSSRLPANIKLNIDLPQDITIPVDAQHMQEVFINLILNSIQAIEPDEGEISVSGSIKESGIQILVKDSGQGMTPDVMSRIFDPFYTTKEVGQGTGLGLSIAYGIIEKAGGKILVSSIENQGTTFTINLPFNRDS